MALHAWSSAKYSFPLPEGHRFPIAKYALLRDRVIADGIVDPEHLHDPAAISRADLLLVHTADYVDRFTSGRLSPDEERRLGFPWSPAKTAWVPFPWWTSRSTTSARRILRSRCSARIAIAVSLKTQKPSPCDGNAWCVPPARFMAIPCSVANVAASSVPPAARYDRSTSAGDQGKPRRRSSSGERRPLVKRST